MNTTAKTLSALLLGAALVTPALAQDAASANNGNGATAQTAPMAAPTTPVDGTATTDTGKPANSMAMPAKTADAMPTPSNSGTQMAMNTSGNAADVSSVPDTQKKYVRAHRAKDFQTEAETTKALNQKGNQLAAGTAQ